MTKINIKIEGVPYAVEEGLTILEAARACGYEIPSLCAFNHGECSRGSCRVCLVEATGARGLVAACVYPVSEGMEITISSPKAVEARRASVELLLSNHNQNCQQCDKNGNCELLHVAQITGAREGRFQGAKTPTTYDELTPTIVRDTSKCILCGRCVARCQNAHGMGILGFENRGFKTIVAPAENRSFIHSPCIMCGQCINVCPTGALMEKSEIARVDAAMKAGKYVVVQTAPAVRAALGEEFGMKIGTPVTGKMVAALRRLGFKKVFDTNFAADLTIMEEATELLGRIQNGGVLPMITSCSPGWIKFCETYYPEFIPNLSSCKSPHEMEGAVIKSYFAEKEGIDPEKIVVVSVMPCTAKKYECKRPELGHNGLSDVDIVITTRELARMIKMSGINFTALPDEDFDPILGESSGAAVIFGVTGGVMEAALRTAYEVITGETLEKLEFTDVRGFEGVKEASYNLKGLEVSVAVAHSTGAAAKLLDAIKAGEKKYTFIEVMGCPGGCVNGGGQPIVSPIVREDVDVKGLRAKALYDEDAAKPVRKSHELPAIKQLYDEYFEKPNSHKAHELLHTTYTKRPLYE